MLSQQAACSYGAALEDTEQQQHLVVLRRSWSVVGWREIWRATERRTSLIFSSITATTMVPTPLVDLLPQLPSTMITDTVETDGRFLVYTIASRESKVFWVTVSSTAALIRKAALSTATTWTIVSLPQRVLAEDDEKEVVKTLVKEIREWSAACDGLVVLDDVSAMATLVGESLAYTMVLSLRSSCSKLCVRCANGVQSYTPVPWLGGELEADNAILWENRLIELFDLFLDVLPLQSGYSREAHGRLVVSQADQQQSVVVNYSLTDTKAMAIRVQRT